MQSGGSTKDLQTLYKNEDPIYTVPVTPAERAVMKRLLSISLAIVVVLSSLLLASCGERKKTDLSNAKTLSDLSGATIAAQTGTFHLDALVQISGITKREYSDFTALLTALKSDAIDGYVAEEPTAYAVTLKNPELSFVPLVNNETGFTASDADTGIAVAFKTDSDMVEKVNAIIDTIPTETRTALMNQMVKASDDVTKALDEALVLSSDNTDISNGTLKIAMECAYQPFNWTQTTDVNGAVEISGMAGSYANGYDVQVAKYIAAELGMSLEIYALEWDALIPAVQSGTVDGIIAGMSPTAEREESVDFTECYYNSNLVIVIKK